VAEKWGLTGEAVGAVANDDVDGGKWLGVDAKFFGWPQ
jgi:hypothetical protein